MACERLKPFPELRRGKCCYGRELLIDCCSFYWEFVVVLDNLAQQAGQKCQREVFVMTSDVIEHNLSGLWRIGLEMLGLEVAWQHGYNRSLMGLPWDWAGEKPMIAPRLGTRSMDCYWVVEDHALANTCSQGHHPGSAAGDIAGAMVLESVAAGIIVRVASEIREDEKRGIAGVFRILLNGLPELCAEAIGAPDAFDVERVCTGVGDVDVVHGYPKKTGRLLLHKALGDVNR